MAARRRTTRPAGIQTRLLAAGSPRVIKVLLAGIAALDAQGARYCLVGGLARSFLAEARSTKDVDFAVSAPSEAAADQVVREMQSSGFVVREVFQRTDGSLATVRLTLGDIPTRCDLLFGTSGLEHIVVGAAVAHEFTPGTRAPVITRAHLIAMKLVAARDQDLIDVGALLDAATPEEVRSVAGALATLPAAKRKAAIRVWKALLSRRRARKPDLFAAPSRARSLQRKSPRHQ